MQQREMAAHRRHDPHAAVQVAETGVDVHAADEQGPDRLLVGHRELLVALARGDDLVRPGGEGMGRGCQDRGPVFRGGVDYHAAGLVQGGANLRNGCADPGGGLYLGAEKLGHDLVGTAVFLAVLEDAAVGVRQEITGLRIDQEELFLDTDCYCEGVQILFFAPASAQRQKRPIRHASESFTHRRLPARSPRYAGSPGPRCGPARPRSGSHPGPPVCPER